MKRYLGEMSFLRLHTAIGLIAFLLPIALVIMNLLQCGSVQPSMSACWYTDSRDIFVGCLYLCGGFFIANTGYTPEENIVFNVCGICFILIANFPCEQMTGACSIWSNLSYLPSFHEIIHYSSAAVLFPLLGVICIFNFTISSGRYTHEKHLRNKLYRTCGVFIFLAIILSFILPLKLFYFEMIMLYSFGTAFIVKGTKGKAVNLHDK